MSEGSQILFDLLLTASHVMLIPHLNPAELSSLMCRLQASASVYSLSACVTCNWFYWDVSCGGAEEERVVV